MEEEEEDSDREASKDENPVSGPRTGRGHSEAARGRTGGVDFEAASRVGPIEPRAESSPSCPSIAPADAARSDAARSVAARSRATRRLRAISPSRALS